MTVFTQRNFVSHIPQANSHLCRKTAVCVPDHQPTPLRA